MLSLCILCALCCIHEPDNWVTLQRCCWTVREAGHPSGSRPDNSAHVHLHPVNLLFGV